jgi:predicted component of type VI protein secretion system
MYMLQLFDACDAVEPIDARFLNHGVLHIGRDPRADWPIADPECALSRAHCELHAGPDGLSLLALGGNGVFDDVDGTRYPDGELSALPVPGAVRVGRFRLVATHAPQALGIDEGRTMILSPPLGTSVEVPSEWTEGPAPARPCDGSLFEAFCEGAQLDSSSLSSEDPEEILRRAGALYRQMVLGLGDLMGERATARARYQLTRTTIGGEANNPFKWAPSQRLAIDLLLAGSSGFLSGPAALQASFRDLKRHLVATFAGLRGGLRHAIESFSPERIEAAVVTHGSLFKSRHALRAEEVARRHADLAAQLEDGVTGSLDQAFVEGYEQAESQLNRGELA